MTTQLNLLQRHITNRDSLLRQSRCELLHAQTQLSNLHHAIDQLKEKYMNLGLGIERPIETKLLCGTIVQDLVNLTKEKTCKVTDQTTHG